MMDDELLTIGRFARLAGLSVGALRHYDELDVLRPADVDPFSGYRRYRRSQLAPARVIARLRSLEVPLEEIRSILATDDPDEQRRRIAAHRSRVEARTVRLQGVLHDLHHLTIGKEPIVTDRTVTELDGATHRRLGVELFNRVWRLLEAADRTPGQTDEMIHAAHASCHHWSLADGRIPANAARGEWQCARVYATLGRAEPALWHARRCLAILEAAGEEGREDWDVAAACEGLARAHAVAGDAAEARRWADRARAELATVADPEDRAVIEGDLATLPL